jgi:WS/DGAT/MGAT family acyltransferase
MDRLSAADLMLVWPERMGWPQDIGALAVLDGGALFDPEGRFGFESVLEHVGRRVHLVPRFRQVMRWVGFGRGWPLWVDARDFDVADHVGVLRLLGPGGEPELLEACARLARRRLDPSRPLWQMWFMTRHSDHRVGLFIKLHHAIADGVAGVAALGAFVDPTMEPIDVRAPAWSPVPWPSSRDILADNLRRRVLEFARTVLALGHPARTARRIWRAWPAVREVFSGGKAPRTSVNRRIGSDRRFMIVRSSLGLMKAIAHGSDATVNDVLLTAVAGGYAELLQSRGEAIDGLVLRAFVPVSLHTETAETARGNVDGGMVAPLPIGERDPVRRLRLISAETAERKKRARPQAGAIFRSVWLQRAFLRLMPRQRFMNAYVANVPGPPMRLYFAGAPLGEIFPVVPLTGNISIGVGALSYAGQFNITVVGDRDLCPDLEIFTDGIRGSLDALANSVSSVVA